MAEYVDFSVIEDKHIAIHDRLINWARWCQDRPGGAIGSPMFDAFKAPDHWGGAVATVAIDKLDASAIEKAVYKLPEQNRAAVRWWYVYRSPPRIAARSLGATMLGLAQLVRDGRQMLLNRI